MTSRGKMAAPASAVASLQQKEAARALTEDLLSKHCFYKPHLTPEQNVTNKAASRRRRGNVVFIDEHVFGVLWSEASP